MRLFVAVDPGERFRAQLATRLDVWREQLRIGWVEARNLHLTLRFLGELPAAAAQELAPALRAAAAGRRAFTLQPGRLAAFPHLRDPRVLFLQMRGDGALEELAAAVRLATDPLLPPEQRDTKPFRAHLTLARVKRPLSAAEARALAAMDAGAWDPLPVADIRLVRSVLGSGGPVYTELMSVPLLPGG